MRRFAVIMLAVLAVALPASAQEHAPTVDTCRADFASWDSETDSYAQAETVRLDSGLPNKSELSRRSATELLKRIIEMGQCLSVDRPNLSDYSRLVGFYREVLGDRALSFIDRHGLSRSFYKEDKAGLR